MYLDVLTCTHMTDLSFSRPASELRFARPGINHEARCTIKVHNDHDSTIAYKVKTTDPKNYRVKPSGGVLQHGHTDTVSIVLLSGI